MPISADKHPRCDTRPLALALHKMIVLEGLAAGESIEDAAWGADVGRSTVEKWRVEDQGFNDACMDAIEDGRIPQDVEEALRPWSM